MIQCCVFIHCFDTSLGDRRDISKFLFCNKWGKTEWENRLTHVQLKNNH